MLNKNTEPYHYWSQTQPKRQNKMNIKKFIIGILIFIIALAIRPIALLLGITSTWIYACQLIAILIGILLMSRSILHKNELVEYDEDVD